MLLAAETDVHLHVCHMTAKGAVEALRWAKSRGSRVTAETSPNYLMLNDEAMTKVGPIAKIDPPLRKPADQEALWGAVKDGTMDVLASDHAPYPREEKEKGWKDIFEAPSGGTGVETSLALMLDNVHRERISIQRLAEMFSANPARIMRLYPTKGALLPGSDADIVIVDMDMEYEIKGEDLQSKQKVTAFEGYRGRGKPVTTIVRGEIVMEDGLVTGRSGYGEFLRPIT
jgi:dihydroorotase (multifunctional complex type)